LSEDLAADRRWPRRGPRASGFGVHSILSAQLYVPDRELGALNLYSREPDHSAPEDTEFGDVLAAQASAALFAAQQTSSLRSALDTRTVIGQAQGILMEKYDLNADQAFANSAAGKLSNAQHP
jgi:GAF domain-containing protein